jgi:hypothetical protein
MLHSADSVGPEVLGQCDNCDLPITEDDDYLFDAIGMLHEACNQ